MMNLLLHARQAYDSPTDWDRADARPTRPPSHRGSQDPRSSRRPPSWPRWLFAVGLWAVVFLMVWSFAGDTTPTATPRPIAPRSDLTSEEKATIEVFKRTSPSIVHVTNIELRRSVFSLDVFEIPKGSGSGFVWDKQGHIVTNYHVVAGSSSVAVTLAGRKPVAAEIVAVAPDRDLAVLKIDVDESLLRPIPIGTSRDLQVGQRVLAIGNPFGLDRTLTTGVVSALGREIQAVTGRKIRGVIQTDAAINPGNSGGPLLDTAGRLIGINTQIASPSGASAGIGFAVPVDIVNETVPDLIRYRSVRRPILGVKLAPDALARQLGLPGVLIESVSEGGGAAEAGLRGTLVNRRGFIRRLGDLIVRVNDQEVNSGNEIKDVLESFKAGDTVKVAFVRDNELHTAVVKLQYIQPR